MQNYDDVAAFAVEQARQAGKIMRQYFEATDKAVSRKEDQTLVTEADMLINSQVVSAVRQVYPGHGVLGEEESYESGRSNLWVCDPIDGTDAFVTGVPTAMFSLAYVVDGEPVVGVAYDPFLDRMFTATKGGGAYVNGRRLQVSTTAHVADAVFSCSGSVNQIAANLPVYSSLMESGARLKAVSGAVYRGTLVASSSIDGFVAVGSAYDFAAVACIVQEAGGTVTNLSGDPQRYDGAIKGIIISNGHLHEVLLHAVADHGVETFLRIQR